jgi:hypothetical protein
MHTHTHTHTHKCRNEAGFVGLLADLVMVGSERDAELISNYFESVLLTILVRTAKLSEQIATQNKNIRVLVLEVIPIRR